MNVPCGECRGCCTSSYFIHIRPDEKKTLAVIPKKLLFAAPGLPKGNVLLGYMENGHCPLFQNNQCSIYDNRPQTCRNYDCRIFQATGLSVEKEKTVIAKQTRKWQFEIRTPDDKSHLLALHSTARFLNRNMNLFPHGFVPNNPTQQAMVAIKVYSVFVSELKSRKSGKSPTPKKKLAESMVVALSRFNAMPNS